MKTALSHQLEAWQRLISGWAATWGCPGLDRRLRLSVSTRLRTSLGRYAPGRGEMRVASFLLGAPDQLLHEVLCHEAAHAAVYELHGRGPKPHGPEWRKLMVAAGFEPRVRLKVDLLAGQPQRGAPARVLWEHRCPVCQVVRLAGRRVPEWRCAACQAAGLAGELVVTRVAASRGADR